MKYVKDSPIIPGAKDFYMISRFSIDKTNNVIVIELSYLEHDENGTVGIQRQEKAVQDSQVYIIDPDWDENSTPPKPAGFNPLDPATWGTLSWDNIPKIADPEKLYVTNILSIVENGNGNTEEEIFKALIKKGDLPSSEEWELI